MHTFFLKCVVTYVTYVLNYSLCTYPILDYRHSLHSMQFFRKGSMSRVNIFVILIALFCLTNELVLSDSNYCYSDDEHPYLYAGTKTAYEVVHGLIKNTTLPSK